MDKIIEVTSTEVATVHAGDNEAEVAQLTCALLNTIAEGGVADAYSTMDACVSVVATIASCLPAEMLQDMRDYTFDAMTTAVDAIEEERSTN